MLRWEAVIPPLSAYLHIPHLQVGLGAGAAARRQPAAQAVEAVDLAGAAQKHGVGHASQRDGIQELLRKGGAEARQGGG